ncbi:hypothetical protein CYMTET_56326 [Cymbomonas tetramitiformis]|uniref:Uncharacterized protein n=1 Tax=Cymbomonas tetramitiformis TaxID=36881 RepID=A0AAE0BB51_9CHLO|nr:hypothetical protein CYMTET_56326 [Cymbomonas tetramitiformis]
MTSHCQVRGVGLDSGAERGLVGASNGLGGGGVATLMRASKRVAAFLGDCWRVGVDEGDGEMWGGLRVELTHAGPLRARGAIPAAMATYNRLHGSTRRLVQLLCPRGEAADRAGTNSEQLSGTRRPDGELSATGRAWDTQWLEVAEVSRPGDTAAVCRQGSRKRAQVAQDEPASGTRQQCASGAYAEGLGWLSEA